MYYITTLIVAINFDRFEQKIIVYNEHFNNDKIWSRTIKWFDENKDFKNNKMQLTKDNVSLI